ncbi:pentapeptide repeat-containing protein [uncultured Roseobacter sp.]|uniref:pentapeptide repeat-containing protein n=1 Tax=uncultured Roseobacter sp. TaxID=114847 RepID=UPI0026295FBC|nr:pentapeptide repeat-containing protein [uncultured Roseobacter sp.]
MFDQVALLLKSKTDDLKTLASLVGMDEAEMFLSVDFSNADLTNHDLSNIDLSGCQLSEAKVTPAQLGQQNSDQRRAISKLAKTTAQGGEKDYSSAISDQWLMSHRRLSEKISEQILSFISEYLSSHDAHVLRTYLGLLSELKEFGFDANEIESVVHLVSFHMRHHGMLANGEVFNTLNSLDFWSLSGVVRPIFGVSKYQPDYFHEFLKNASSFDECADRLDLVTRNFCGATVEMLSICVLKAESFRQAISIFSLFVGRAPSPNADARNHTLELIVEIDDLMDFSRFSSFDALPPRLIHKFFDFRGVSDRFKEFLESITDAGVKIDPVILTEWIERATSYVEAEKRALLAQENAPDGREMYKKSLYNMINTHVDLRSYMEIYTDAEDTEER